MAIEDIGYPGPVETGARNDATPQIKVGTVLRLPNGTMYKYVQHNQGTDVTATLYGGVAYLYTQDGTVVTADQGDGNNSASAKLASVNHIAGFYLGVVTHLYYSWIQIWGVLTAVPVPASTAQGDALIGTTTDNLLARVAAGTAPTNKVGAWALTAVASNKSDIYIAVGG